MSVFTKLISALFSFAFDKATSNASLDISLAVIFIFSNSFFRAILMHPDPVPTSNISTGKLKYFFIYFIKHIY